MGIYSVCALLAKFLESPYILVALLHGKLTSIGEADIVLPCLGNLASKLTPFGIQQPLKQTMCYRTSPPEGHLTHDWRVRKVFTKCTAFRVVSFGLVYNAWHNANCYYTHTHTHTHKQCLMQCRSLLLYTHKHTHTHTRARVHTHNVTSRLLWIVPSQAAAIGNRGCKTTSDVHVHVCQMVLGFKNILGLKWR